MGDAHRSTTRASVPPDLAADVRRSDDSPPHGRRFVSARQRRAGGIAAHQQQRASPVGGHAGTTHGLYAERRAQSGAVVVGLRRARAGARSDRSVRRARVLGDARRTREIGIRIAVGAEPRHVFRLVLDYALRRVAVGLTAGLALSLALSRTIAGLLYGVSADDPLTLAGVLVLLVGVGALAGYVPARRAARIDPVATALRAE